MRLPSYCEMHPDAGERPLSTDRIIAEIRAPLLERIRQLEEMVFHLEERLGYKINPEWIALGPQHDVHLATHADIARVDYVDTTYRRADVGPAPQPDEHLGPPTLPG